MSGAAGQSELVMLQKFISMRVPLSCEIRRWRTRKQSDLRRFSITKTAACAVMVYADPRLRTIGIILLCRRDFSRARD
jgi:hypothetical protein